jgi:aminopeptidase N
VVEKAPVTFKLGGCDDAIKLNAGSRGYYRVACDGPMFDRLRGAWSKLTEIDRVSFLSDAWAMLESGKLPVNVYLDLLPKVADETSLAVWEQTLGALETIDGILERQPQQADFRRRVLALLRPALAKLGMSPRNGESTALGLLRARLLGVTGGMGDREVVAEARRRFEMFRKDSTALTGDLRATFLNIVGRHAMPTDYAELRRLAKAATDEEDREILLGALSLAEDENIARETLELSLAKDFPPVESARLVSQVSGSGRHPQLAWDFMKQHHREIMQMVAGPFQNMYTGSTVSGFDDDARAAEFLEFIKTHFPPDAIAKAEEAADGIRYRAQLKREIQPAVDKWSHEGDLR